MPLTDVENIYLGRDNPISFIAKQNGTAQDLSGTTQIDFRIHDEVLSSTNSTGGEIRWGGSGYTTGEIRIFAGSATSVTLTTGAYTCALVLYDATNPNGVLWDDNIPVRVKANILTT